MILLEMQNDANQHILFTISITKAGSSCDAFCPLYLSQWWSVCTCRRREVSGNIPPSLLGVHHTVPCTSALNNPIISNQRLRMVLVPQSLWENSSAAALLLCLAVHKLMSDTPFFKECSAPCGIDNSLLFSQRHPDSHFFCFLTPQLPWDRK